MANLAKKCPKITCQGMNRVIFKTEFLHLFYDSDSWSWDFKIEFFPLQTNLPFTHLCLIVGLGSISRVLVVLWKTVVRIK